MRNFITLLTAGTLIVACADDPHPTDPGSRSAAGSAQRTADKAPVGQAKPVDQVGFTKVTQVFGAATTINAGQVGSATVTCISGTAIAGGHIILAEVDAAPEPRLTSSYPNDTNGWTVSFSNTSPGSAAFDFRVVVNCAS